MKKNIFINKKGFTLIELLVVIAIIGLLTAAAVFTFNITRMQARDVTRSSDINTFNKALAMYINEYGVYPDSVDGECLVLDSGVGKTLVDEGTLVSVPTDPFFVDPAISYPTPSSISNCVPGASGYVENSSCANSFCYWYDSDDGSSYYISYFLETSSKAGDVGVHVMAPAGNQ